MLLCLFGLSAALVLGCALHFWYANLLVFDRSPVFGYMRPQLGALLVSTEMSNILAVVLLLAWASRCLSFDRTSRSIIGLTAVPVLILFVMMMSIGSIVVLSIVAIGLPTSRSARGKRVRNVRMALSVAVVGFYLLLCSGVSDCLTAVGGAVFDKVLTDGRNEMYRSLFAMIASDPFRGCGFRTFLDETGIHPHHNILGIWAEMGILCVSIYLIHFGIGIYWAIKTAIIRLNPHRDGTLAMASACFCAIVLYLHMKGFVQDTWYDLPLTFFTGSMLGLCQSAYSACAQDRVDCVRRIGQDSCPEVNAFPKAIP